MNTKQYHVALWLMVALLVLQVVSLAVGVYMITSLPKQLEAAMAARPVVVEAQVAPIPTKEPSLRDLQKGKPFLWVGTNVNHPVVKIMELGFWDACKKYDVDCKFMAVDGNDIAGLVTQMDTIVANGASGITSSIYDKAFYAPTNLAIKAGIPVVNWHMPMKPEDIPGLKAWVSADIVDYATRAAKEMAKAIDCKGTVAVTQGSLTATETPVGDTFRKVLKETCPNVTVLETQEEGYDPPQAIAKAVAILTAHPEVNGAFSTTGAGPTTWSGAVQEVGKKDGEVKIISMDYSLINLDLLKAGKVHALVGQPLYEENYKAVELLIQVLKGEKVAFDNPYPAPIILAGDAEKYYDIANRGKDFDALSMNK